MKNLLYLSVVVSGLCFVPVQGDTKSRGASEGGYKECTFIKQNKLISWGRSSNFIQVCFERTGRYGRDEIYMWGTPAGRSGGLKLAKVLPKQILKRITTHILSVATVRVSPFGVQMKMMHKALLMQVSENRACDLIHILRGGC